MSNETNTPAQAAAAPMKLDVSVRPISPIDNLIGFANVTINDSFSVEGFRICSGDKGLYVVTASPLRRCRPPSMPPELRRKSRPSPGH